jgi:hypothetical protein
MGAAQIVALRRLRPLSEPFTISTNGQTTIRQIVLKTAYAKRAIFVRLIFTQPEDRTGRGFRPGPHLYLSLAVLLIANSRSLIAGPYLFFPSFLPAGAVVATATACCGAPSGPVSQCWAVDVLGIPH